MDRKKELLDLPNELLVTVAQDLDIESLTALEQANSRLRDVCKNVKFTLKENKITDVVLDFLNEHGERVRSVDFEDCTSPLHYIQEAVIKCPNATELNLVNSTVSEQCLLVFRVLEHLLKLKTLKFTLDAYKEIDEKKYGNNRFNSLRKLYVDIFPDHVRVAVLINIMSACDSLEECHVNMLGNCEFPEESDKDLPILKAERWETLHTFICTTHHCAPTRATRKLLECVFAEKARRKISAWMRSEKMCYIYERGYFNGMLPRSGIKFNDQPEIIPRCLEVVLTGESSRIMNPFETPWGKASSLRIIDPDQLIHSGQYSLNDCLSKVLIELDFRDAHGLFKEFDPTDFAESAPFLEVLALPKCFLRTEMTSPLSNLRRLRKFIVKGAEDNEDKENVEHPTSCSCNDGPVTASVLPVMSDLPNLEEVTYDNVQLRSCVFKEFSHPRVHTIRLNLRKGSTLDGFRTSLKRCPNLKNLMFRTVYKSVLGYLTAAPNLKQLCVGSRTSNLHISQQILDALLVKAELLHVHVTQQVPLVACQRLGFRGYTMHHYKDEMVLTWEKEDQNAIGHLPGRFLCSCDPLIGFVKPTGWR